MMQLSLWFCAFIGSMLYSLVLLDYGSTQNVKMIDEIINSQQVDKKNNLDLQYNVNWSVPHRTSMFLSTLSLCVRTLSVLIHIIMDVFIELNIWVSQSGGGHLTWQIQVWHSQALLHVLASLKPASSKNMNGFHQLLSHSKYAFTVQKTNSDNNDTDFGGGVSNTRHLETDQAWTYSVLSCFTFMSMLYCSSF